MWKAFRQNLPTGRFELAHAFDVSDGDGDDGLPLGRQGTHRRSRTCAAAPPRITETRENDVDYTFVSLTTSSDMISSFSPRL